MNIDWYILSWIQDNLRCIFLDWLMPLISALGNGGAVWLAAAAVLLCFRKYRRYGVLLLMGLAAGVLVGNLCLKNIVARPRPCWLDTTVQLLISSPDDYSFPSGHTAASFAAVFALRASGSPLWKPAAVLASVIAFSRLYLYVHWPTDVLGGIVVGAVVGTAGAWIAKRLRKKLGEIRS